jgi:hypothetical protein
MQGETMKKRLFRLLITGMTMLVTTQAHAHLDGDHHHMSVPQGLLHFLSEPTHVAYLVGGVIVGGYLFYVCGKWQARGKIRNRRRQ